MMSGRKVNTEPVVRHWKDAIGEHNVDEDPEVLMANLADIAEYSAREVVAILRASTVAEVKSILQIANRNQVAVYPVSTGRNWGFGSSKPVKDGCAVLDLQSMNQIRELNLDQGYAIIEPGVTQRHLSEALLGTPFMLNVTGSCADTSIIGNALERGLGFIRQRTEDILGLEVVLANGDLVHIGSFWSNGIDSFHYKHGIGPDIMPMFFQSNFGIITAAVVSLIPRPEKMRLVQAQFNGGDLEKAIDTFAQFYQQGILRTVFKAFNTSAMRTYGIASDWHSGVDKKEFTVFGTLMGTTKTVDCFELLVIEALKEANCFYNLRSIDRESWADEVPDQIALPYQGVPTCEYIKNSFGVPCHMVNTEAKRGMFLFPPLISLEGKSVRTAYEILDQTVREYQIPINASVNMVPSSIIDLVISITFNRTPDEIERIHKVKEVLHHRFQEQKMLPYRVDIEHQDPAKLYKSESRVDILRKLKLALDPNSIISPGRYTP